MDAKLIFGFLSKEAAKGHRTALVTITDVSGSSMRNPGTHMGVSETGAYVGSLSGGCIEAAVVAEAAECIAEGKPRLIRFGAGSPYLDIKLPCGGGLDLLFTPNIEGAHYGEAFETLDARKPIHLFLPLDERIPVLTDVDSGESVSKDNETYIIGHVPAPKIIIVGHGAAVRSLAMQAQAFGAELNVLTPDNVTVEALTETNIKASLLTKVDDSTALRSDPWTAIVFLFHDHDWEGALMKAALAQPSFYVGAMGSRAAHSNRLEILRALDVSRDQLEKMHAPIGVIHSSRDPDTLALSILTEIIREYHCAIATKN